MKISRPPAISSAVFVPDYPHSVLKARFALKRDPRADFPEIILARLSSYCRQYRILISILPQSPVFVLRIEGALVAVNPEREDCRYVVQNRHLAFGNRSIIDESILSSAFRFVFPAYKRGITTRIGVFEENRDASIVSRFIFPTAIEIDREAQFAYRKNCPPELFKRPHGEP